MKVRKREFNVCANEKSGKSQSLMDLSRGDFRESSGVAQAASLRKIPSALLDLKIEHYFREAR
jgi:hypothetical protein